MPLGNCSWQDREASHLVPAKQTRITDIPTLLAAPYPFGKVIARSKWAQIQFKVHIGFPLVARPQAKPAHALGSMNAFYLVGRQQAGPWEQGLAHCFTKLCAIAKVKCPEAGPLLPSAAALHRYKVLSRIAGDSICQMKICCCPCSKENSAPACESIVQDMKHEFMLPLCHCPCPNNSIVRRTWGRALLEGKVCSWSPAILARIQNQQSLWHWWWKSWTAAAFPFNRITTHLPLVSVQIQSKLGEYLVDKPNQENITLEIWGWSEIEYSAIATPRFSRFSW